MAQRPPDLGELQQIIPVAQTQTYAGWTVALVSVERWDQGFVVNFDIHQAGPIPPPARQGDRGEPPHPHVVLVTSDDRGDRYQDIFASGYGGGGTDGSRYRLVRRLIPPIPLTTRELRFEGRLQLMHRDPPSIATTVPGQWTFTVVLPLDNGSLMVK